MASLSFNRLVGKWRQRVLQTGTGEELADQMARSGDCFQDFVLTAAQMDALNATPVSILAAPGAGLVNIVTGLIIRVNSTGFTAFELGSGVLEVRYTDASGAKVVTDIVNGTVESATDLVSYSPPIVALPVVNAAIVAHTSTDVTAGTGNIQGRLYYKTVKLAEIA